MTRLHVYGAALLAWLALAALCAFPTLAPLGRALGGGPVRQWVVNELLAPMLPRAVAEAAVGLFNNAGPGVEWLLAVGTLAPYVAALVPVLFGIAYLWRRIREATHDPLLN